MFTGLGAAGRSAYALAAPAFVLMLMMLIGPLAGVMALSFTDYQLGAPSFSWIGLSNYHEMFADRVFWISLKNTLTYVAIVVPGAVALGLGVALLIQSGAGLRSWYRTVYFLPVMATLIAMAIVWEFMLHPQFGLVNGLLRAAGLQGHSWLQDRGTALYSLCVIGIWQATGFNMVLFLAGLVSIPKYLYDAAEIDGAESAWSRFRLVTWPMLGPVTLFVVTISAAIRSFQVFDTVQVRTRGRTLEIVRGADLHDVHRRLRVFPLRLWRSGHRRVPGPRAAGHAAQSALGNREVHYA